MSISSAGDILGGTERASTTMKFSVEQLKRKVSAAEESDRDRIARIALTQAERRVSEANTSLAGITTLLNVAWLDSLVEGFPDDIHMAAPNGYMSGVHARKRNGKWSMHFAEGTRYDAFPGNVVRDMGDLSSRVLKAMGIPHGPAAYREIVELGKWPVDGMAAFIAAVTDRLPVDTMRASAGYLASFLHRHGIEQSRMPSITKGWVKHAHGLGDLAEPLADQLASPATIAAQQAYPGVLVAMKSAGVDLDRPLPPGHPWAGTTPLAAALASGKFANASTLLGRLGASAILPANAMNETALHLLAQGILLQPTHPLVEEARGLANDIAAAGVDPDAVDLHGRTAAALIREALSQPEQELDAYAVRELERIEAILENPRNSTPSY